MKLPEKWGLSVSQERYIFISHNKVANKYLVSFRHLASNIIVLKPHKLAG